LRKNLARVSTDLSDLQLNSLLEEAMSSYMRYWCDTFRFPNWDNNRINETVTVTREELLLDGIKSGRGVIVALPHAGNWDHAGAYFCLKGIHLVTVAERLKPERLFNKFLQYRQAMGMEVLALDSRSIETLAQRLREGHLIALVADRDLSKSGINVEFFGKPARMPAGPAVLAIKTGAVFLTAFVNYTPSGIHITFDELFIPESGTQEEKVAALVQKSANNFEQGISQHPQDWHMLQRIWIDEDFKERT
jgi:KDO2-lipid IV(A) lauroyltransferase